MKKKTNKNNNSVTVGSSKNSLASTKINNRISNLQPNMGKFITGFADAESNFYVLITKKSKMKTGWGVECIFSIRLHLKDVEVLKYIQDFFHNIGKIYIYENIEEAIFRVSSIKELEIIMNHFDKYPLITQKWSDFMLFKQVFYLMKCKKHLTLEGIQEIVNIKASMNTKISLSAFSNIVPVIRLSVPLINSIDPFWFAGFSTGEACFSLSLKKSPSSKLGETAWLRFIITQHVRDKYLINSFVNFFGCGKINQDSQAVYYVVSRLSDLTDIIIPFFDKYPIMGVKVKDFEDFKYVSVLMKNKNHLTKEGLEEIRKIKSRMNTLRK